VIKNCATYINFSNNLLKTCINKSTAQSKADIAVHGNYLTAMGNHMPYGITQCCQPPCSGDFPAFTPDKAGTQFSNPGAMQG